MTSVTHVITTICRGGAENQLVILCAEQVRMGLEVRVIPLKGAPDLLGELLEVGVNVDLSFIGKSFLSQLLLIVNKTFKTDIWHAHLPQAELLLSFKRKEPLVVSRHFGGKFYPAAPTILSILLARFASRNASQIIAISNYVATYLKTSREVSCKKSIRVVQYGFNSTEFNKGININTNKSPKSNSFLKFGSLVRLSPEKDVETMIRGFDAYNSTVSPKSQLEIYGSGSEKKKLLQLINDLGLNKQVFLKGRTNRVAEILRDFDCFILTSRFEGFGMVLLEAMAADLPIVCSRIPAALEVLGEDGAAIYFAPGSPADLSVALQNAEKLDLKTRKTEQQKRLNLFSAQKMAQEINDIYLGISRYPD
jgi:glycosyltransferase involved in cell wall biosynthesis